MAHKIFFKKGDEISIYKIIKCIGIKTLANKRKDVHFIVKCKRCGYQREMQQKSLRYYELRTAYYCHACPPKMRLEAKKEKEKIHYKKRRAKKYLNDEEAKLFRLAIYGKLS